MLYKHREHALIDQANTAADDIPDEWELELYNQKQLERMHGISSYLFTRGLRSGVMNNVRAPRYVQNGKTYCVSRAEVERYKHRLKRFHETYLTYEAVGEYFSWNHYGTANGSFNVRHKMVSRGHYMRIVPPPHYKFELNRRKYFHIVDVKVMVQAVIKSVRNQLKATTEQGFDRRTGTWQPRYLMPSDEQYYDQYKEETKRLIAVWQMRGLRAAI